MSDRRAYHHGNLRAVLLAEAERTLREQGADQLSLRELARQTGVSHGAPRRHFVDRQALLDALADNGFSRLADEMCSAISDDDQDYSTHLQAAANAYVRFAIHNGALLALMFATKKRRQNSAPADGAARVFSAVSNLIVEGQSAQILPPGDPERLRLLLLATLQGIAVLVTSGRAPVEQADNLIAGALDLFTPGLQHAIRRTL